MGVPTCLLAKVDTEVNDTDVLGRKVMDDETLEKLMVLNIGFIIWLFPQYEWKMIALFRFEIANA